jgi:hypothetical protein
MPGQALNPDAEMIPLPIVAAKKHLLVTPDTLRDLRPKVKRWFLHVHFNNLDFLPLFEVPKFVIFDQRNRYPWATGRVDEYMWRIGQEELAHSLDGEAVLLGPNWHGYVSEIYWAVSRAIYNYFQTTNDEVSQNDGLLSMALEAMMRSHGRM